VETTEEDVRTGSVRIHTNIEGDSRGEGGRGKERKEFLDNQQATEGQ
jgi:hypothetical protein